MAEQTKQSPDSPPAPRQAGFVLCDVCGGVLYPKDAPRHPNHTPEELAAAGIALTPKRDPAAEAAEQVS